MVVVNMIQVRLRSATGEVVATLGVPADAKSVEHTGVAT